MAVVGIAAVGALAVGCSSSASDDSSSTALSGQIVWADYGGATNESRQAAYFDSFIDETGVDVVSTDIEDAVYQSELAGEEGDYDVFQAGISDILPNLDNLLEVPSDAQGDLLPDEVQSYYIGGFVFGIAQGWLSDTYADGGPQDWADFFDTETYPGKRAWPGSPGSYDASYEIALLADGVAPEDLYPLDIERAEAKLDTIRDDLVFYTAYSEVPSLLTSGSAAIAVTVTGQFQSLINSGEDVTVQWNQAFAIPSGFVAPSTIDNVDEVNALAEWMNDPERQAVFTERTGYGPVNSATFDYLSDDVKASVVNSPDHTDLLDFDEQWRADNTDELLDSYTAWLAG
ncbi:MAG: extracellular solute-binding protein [Microbacterium sp.]